MLSNIIIGPDGNASFIYADSLAELLGEGQAQIERASHVEPASSGGWLADMGPSGGPVLMAGDGKGFALRQDALDAEVAWLNENVFHV